MPRATKTGFSLIELLVVVTILGLMTALLLPAVQSAREAARRIQCTSNLKQLGLGLQQYETGYGVYPPSMVLSGKGNTTYWVGGWSVSRSYHPGGVNVLFGDGGVRFIKGTINGNTWRALGSVNGSEIISAEQY